MAQSVVYKVEIIKLHKKCHKKAAVPVQALHKFKLLTVAHTIVQLAKKAVSLSTAPP